MKANAKFIEDTYTFIPLEERPAILLWATEINYKVDHHHIIWLEKVSLDEMKLHYGYLQESGERTSLAAMSNRETLHVSREAQSVYPMRMITTLRWLWRCCLVVTSPMKRYRWYRLPEQLEDALSFHKTIYETETAGRYLYGQSNTETN